MKTHIVYSIIIVLLLSANVMAYRINRPPTFSLPWNRDQMTQLNNTLESLWELTNGEFNLDIVTNTKTKAENGDIWIIQTGVTSTIQWKANDSIYNLPGSL